MAPAGTGTDSLGPRDLIRPSWIIIVWFSVIGPPVPSITRTCSSATAGASTRMNCRVRSEKVGRFCAAKLSTSRTMTIAPSATLCIGCPLVDL